MPTSTLTTDASAAAVGAGDRRLDLRQQALAAIERGDRHEALRLLRGVAEGELDGAGLADQAARALVSTAAEQATAADQQRRAAALRATQARRAILEQLDAEPLGEQDLLDIDAAVHTRLRRLAEVAPREWARAAGLATTARRLGSGTIEAKLVTNGRSSKRFGPYLYARFAEGGRYRSRYIGKAPPPDQAGS